LCGPLIRQPIDRLFYPFVRLLVGAMFVFSFVTPSDPVESVTSKPTRNGASCRKLASPDSIRLASIDPTIMLIMAPFLSSATDCNPLDPLDPRFYRYISQLNSLQINSILIESPFRL